MPQSVDEAGNIWEVDAQGKAVRLVQAAGGSQMPVDPTFNYKGPQAGANVQKTVTDINKTQTDIKDTAADNSRADLQLVAELYAKGLRPDGRGGVEPIPNWAPPPVNNRGDAQQQGKLDNLEAMARQINRVAELYRSGPGSTGGLWGLTDYLPTDSNKQFDTATAGLGDIGRAAFRVPGSGDQSNAELTQFLEANRPFASDKDVVIEEKLRQLRQRVDIMRENNGLPPANWSAGQQAGYPMGNPTPWDRQTAPQADTVATGPTRTIRDPRLNAQIDTMVNAGASADEINATLAAAGYPAMRPEDYAAAKQWMAENPGTKYSGADATREEDLGALARLAGSPYGAFMAKGANALTGGIPQALAGSQGAGALDAMGEMYPGASLTGEMAGAIGATAFLGGVGGNLASKVAPSLLRGGKLAQAGRNLATDAAYGAIYNGTTEGDPLGGAVGGAIGSAVGQGVGGAIGRGLSGIRLGDAAKALAQRDIPMTVAQKLGGTAARIEDKAMSYPVIGDLIRNRRMEGIEAFNREAFKDAGASIKALPKDIGEEGIQELYDAAGQAYDDATRGVSAPFDQQFMGDMQGVYNNAQRMPQDRQRALGEIMDARIAHIADTGQMTGEQFQQAVRALKANRSSVPGQFQGFEQEYRDAISGTMDALRGTMERGGGQRTVDGLQAADAAYRNTKTLAKATNAAAGGSATGENFMFTPSQLQRAGIQSAAKFPGPRPFADLADAGQAVLPSRVPNSGTADRAAQMLIPGVLGAGSTGAGVGYLADGSDGAQSGAGVGAALALLAAAGGTKAGQKALGKALFDRPNGLRDMGEKISKRKGLFGSAAVPLVFATN